jgi:integrase
MVARLKFFVGPGVDDIRSAAFDSYDAGSRCGAQLEFSNEFASRQRTRPDCYGIQIRLTKQRGKAVGLGGMRRIFNMSVEEGYLRRNPAALLFTSRECKRPARRIMTLDEVRQLFSVLNIRERLIAKLVVLAGMRPGEIFGLKWERLGSGYADIRQRVYCGDVDSPKSVRSVRFAALSNGLLVSIDEWRALSLDGRADAWVFPSEKLTTPLAKDNCWRRGFLPRLKPAGLAWANFQVMRRTHSSLLEELGVDPHVRAEQMGHTVDVNENVYTITSINRRKKAVNALEKALDA